MATKVKKDLTWMDVDVDSIKGPVASRHGEYKKAADLAKKKRGEFEEAFIAEARKKGAIEDSETLRFGYNFGKLAVAKDVKDGPKKAGGGTFKL